MNRGCPVHPLANDFFGRGNTLSLAANHSTGLALFPRQNHTKHSQVHSLGCQRS